MADFTKIFKNKCF